MYDVVSMDRQHVLEEIRRTAKANGGMPLGHVRFEQETGIRYHDWWGKHWGRWGDALQEAGFSPNTLQAAFSDDELLAKLVGLIRELGRFPGNGDLRLKKRNDSTFPNDKVFGSHFGSRARLREAVIAYSRSHGFEDVPSMCGPIVSGKSESTDDKTGATQVVVGFVYLMKHGGRREYKIGKTNAMGRREYELAIQLPEKLRTIHVIKTDDPEGIEEYWHKRFASKRGNGEWFNLELSDIQAFKRRKFM
jgi:hypothetical protein